MEFQIIPSSPLYPPFLHFERSQVLFIDYQRRIKRFRAATFSWMEGKKIESITRAMADTSKTRALNERLCKYARARLG